MSEHSNCLNCGKHVNNKFCDECGQSVATHRFSLKHVFSHDLIHGLFHFDKGFFYTAKELLTRPGHSIREYIDGKRVKHYNYIAFLLLLTAIYVFFLTSANDNFVHSMHIENAAVFNNIMQKYSKVSYLIAIPLSAVMTLLCFPRAHQNFAEHLVMNTYKSGGTLLINVVFSLFTHIVSNGTQAGIVLALIGAMPFIYSFWFYGQYFKQDYPLGIERMVRILFAMILLPVISMILIFGFVYLFYREAAEQAMESFIHMQQIQGGLKH
jgi:hypothetical protein